MEVLEDHAKWSCPSNLQRGQKMAIGHESIGKRLWGAVRPSLGTVTLYIVYESSLTEFQRFLHFLCGLRRPCSCASTAVGHDTNFLDHITKFGEENTDWIRRLCQEEDWGGLTMRGWLPK